MRCEAIVLPAELLEELGDQLRELAAGGDREALMYLLGDASATVELLSGEWRVLLDALGIEAVGGTRRARAIVEPADSGRLRQVLDERATEWLPLSHGLLDLRRAIDGQDEVGVFLIEEPDDWLWVERNHELLVVPPETWELLRAHFEALLESEDFATLTRLVGDHAYGAVEFTEHQTSQLLSMARDQAPGLLEVARARMVAPDRWSEVRELLAKVSDPEQQASLDAFLRVYAGSGTFGLYFRDAASETDQLQRE